MKSTIQMTDCDLIRLFKSGDVNALDNLIRRHKDKIYTSIFMLLKDKAMAEDMFQNTFIKVIETIRGGNYNEEGKFLPWVLRIAHNLCLDHFRKVKRAPKVKNTDNEYLHDNMLFSEDGADVHIVRRQTHDKVRRLLDFLPNEQQEVIVLRHYAELSFKEIATLTNCSINTALGRMRYAIINLRRMMDEKQIAV